MTGDPIDDPTDCRDRVEERIKESPLPNVGYFHRVRAGTKQSVVSHSDPANLSMSVPTSGNYGICASPDDTLVLIDIDDHKDGYDTDALQHARDELPDTLTFSSAHDGEGRLYHVPEDDAGQPPSERLKNTFGAANISECSWGEIRTHNQYIVGAGSQLDGDGCTKDGCQSCATEDGGRYTIMQDAAIATLDIDSLIDILREDRDVGAVDDDKQSTIDDADPVDSVDSSGENATATDSDTASDDDDTDGVQTPYDAVDDLDVVDVAEQTIVHRWNTDDSHTSGDGVRAFYPIWGKNSNGTANVVGQNGWKDTGGRGKGGPIVMAAIASDDISIFDDDDDHKAQPGDVTGKSWVDAYKHLKDDLGCELPELTPSSLDDVDDAEKAATALEMTLRLYENDPERSMQHWEQIWKAIGMLPTEQADQFADRVSDVCNVPSAVVAQHAEYVSHEQQNGPIVVDGGKTWYIAGQPRRRYQLLNFELDVESTLSVERGPIRAELRADLQTGESFTKSVEPKVFNRKERFDDEILSESFGTKFDIPTVEGDQPYVQDLLDALRLWVHNQDAPHRTGVRHMGLYDDELVVPDRTLTADGWTDAPAHVYLEREVGAERRVHLPDDDAVDDLDAVADIIETLPQTRDSERLLPVLGWFYAAPLRPVIESFSESGEFNHLSVTGDTGSGKTATLGYLWRCFGMSGEPFSVDSSSFAQLATFSATNSIPLWFDEYKPSDIRDYKVDRFHDLYRKATRGAFAERGNADKTTTSYKIQAPVVVSGEQSIQGPAERRRSVMTQFRSETTDPGTDTARRFKELIGGAVVDGDDIQIGTDAPNPSDHALAYYQFVCDADASHLQELWYDALERAHRRLDAMGVVDALDDLEIQAVQTVIFGYDIMKEFAGRVGADVDALPSRGTLDDAIGYMVDRIGPGGSRKSHADRFIELFGRAAAAGDYVERGTHYELTKEGKEAEEIRINLPRTFDSISKYARDHDIESTDLLNDHTDYRDRFDELASTPGTYVMRTQQYTPGVSNCTGLKTSAVIDAIEFDRDVLETNFTHPDDKRSRARSDSDDDRDGDGDGRSGNVSKKSRNGNDSADEGVDASSSNAAEDILTQPIGDISADKNVIASAIGKVDIRDGDGFGSSDGSPHFTTHLTDDTGDAKLVIWDKSQMPDIIDRTGAVASDALLIRNADVDSYDGELQLVVSDRTMIKRAQAGAADTSAMDAGDNQQLAETDGGSRDIEGIKGQLRQFIARNCDTDDELTPAIVAGEPGIDAGADDAESIDAALQKLTKEGMLDGNGDRYEVI